MNFRNFFENKKAVSPVIGVVLMVAITVILAAAVGSSVFGQGTSDPAPQANINIKAGTIGATNNTTIILEHLGGDPVNFDTVDNSTGTVTKVVATIDDISYDVQSPSSAIVLDVGDAQLLTLNGTSSSINVNSGDTVNIKLIDVATKQLICNKNVRF